MTKIHLVNVGENNGGDLLMARAAISALSERLGSASVSLNGRILIHPSLIKMQGSIENRIERRIGKQLTKLFHNNAQMFGPGDLVLDINGYRHGGIWPKLNFENDIILAKNAQRAGAYYIMCPKSFGPFDENSKDLFRDLSQYSTKIFARDVFSFEQITKIIGTSCSLCPDYTNGFPSIKPNSTSARILSFIPNSKLVERKIFENYDLYAKHILECRDIATKAGYRFRVLFHQRKDFEKLKFITHHSDYFYNSDPIKLKYEIGASSLVFSSRYHGMIGALSQGIPCVVLGWTEKYKGYLDNYDVGHCLLLSSAQLEEVRKAIYNISIEENYSLIVKSINKGNYNIRQKLSKMWDEVAGLVA